MPRGDRQASKEGARLDPCEADRLALQCERQALALLLLRGAQSARPSQPPLDASLYDRAAGLLRRAARLRNETPVAILARLGVTGTRRRRLLADTGGLGSQARFRMTTNQRKRASDTRAPPTRVGDEVLNRRRAAVLGIAYGSPAWDRLMAQDRAFERRMEQRRRDCLPTHNGVPIEPS